MKCFLKTKQVTLDDDITITITQLSGLDRYDFMDYCTNLPKPNEIAPIAEDATPEERENYINAMASNLTQWQCVTFKARSRLVAYGYREGDDCLENRHRQVMESMTPEQIDILHNEIAAFSGIPLPEPETLEESAVVSEQEAKEPVDPKA